MRWPFWRAPHRLAPFVAPLLRVLLFALVILIGAGLGRLALQSDVVRNVVSAYGYLGVLAIAVVSGFNAVVPVPAVAFVPLFVSAGLSKDVTVLLIVLGVTAADLVAFSLGRAGHDIPRLKEAKLMRKLEKIRERHYWWPIGWMFLHACFAPLPNEVLAVPLGLMGYPLRHVGPAVLFGNLVFNVLVANGLLALLHLA